MPAQKTSSMQAPTPQQTNLPFSLQDGETIVKTIKPAWNGFMMKNVIGSFLVTALVLGYLFAFLFYAAIHSILLSLVIIVVLALAIAYVTAVLSYGKYQYWITNMRVIGSRGIIGYSTDSIPLEMIADVIVNRGIIDRILGLSTLFIMPIGGMGMMYGAGMSGTNYLTALTQADAVRIQKDILDARNRRKKDMSK